MKALMAGKANDLILNKLEELQNEQKEIELQLEVEKSGMFDFSFTIIRQHIKKFKHLDYKITKNRQALVDTFVNKIWLQDDNTKAKIRYNVTDSTSGSFLERMVEVRRYYNIGLIQI